MKRAEHVACMGEMENLYKVLVSKVEGKRLLVRTRHRWEDNITMDLKKEGVAM
jgi:hypothetical protein